MTKYIVKTVEGEKVLKTFDRGRAERRAERYSPKAKVITIKPVQR